MTFSEQEIQALFGHEAAEDEDPQRLREYYFKGSIYEQVITDLPLRIVVGHKGVGKSALFQIAMQEDQENNRLSILIKPDDIIDLKTDENDFLSSIRDWKRGLIEIIATKILNSLNTDSADFKGILLKYGGRIVDFLKETFSNLSSVNLDPAKRLLVDSFLANGKIYIYLDDLDRGWRGQEKDIRKISALLNAVRDLARECKGLHFRIGLRSDVFYLVRTSDESTDKIEGSVIWLSWTNHEIFALLVKRLETFFGRNLEEKVLMNTQQSELANFLNPIFESRFQGLGHWANAPIHRV